MCGIIAAATEKSVGKLLVKGLYKMEYRGYDSAGVALHQIDDIAHLRSLGKVKKLESKMVKEKPMGFSLTILDSSFLTLPKDLRCAISSI